MKLLLSTKLHNQDPTNHPTVDDPLPHVLPEGENVIRLEVMGSSNSNPLVVGLAIHPHPHHDDRPIATSTSPTLFRLELSIHASNPFLPTVIARTSNKMLLWFNVYDQINIKINMYQIYQV
jgi:hypothetical protein